ncbi:MAG: hypothetical protein GF418_11105 [Chitinivibrionales bacterium]|nr:hypothetical protein [Chitinivibrionales bacterium]MBD3396163.1 hypothetical protein [Chitinivibrionales bacterium]
MTRTLALLVLLIPLCACFPPAKTSTVEEGPEPAPTADTAPEAPRPEAAKPQETSAEESTGPEPAKRSADTKPEMLRPKEIPVAEWTGLTFLLLEKVEMFRTHGHHLYTTPSFEDDPAPINPAIELENHRLRYEPFAGHVFTVTNVGKQPDGEYVIVGKMDTLDLTVYGKTSNGIIEGILVFDDLAEAKTRWEGTTVYSKRRLVDIYDSTKSTFRNRKVSILDPLRVLEVRPGIIPLPPKPVWLVVMLPNGSGGIIPLHYSWTNVLDKKKSPGMPWEQDILEYNPKLRHRWDPYVWETIDGHHVFVGMTKEQLMMSWGHPRKTEKVDSVTTKWIYGNSTLIMKGDTVSATMQ